MWGLLQRAVQRMRRGHYKRDPPMIRPTERRKRAAEALKQLPKDHEDYGVIEDYASGKYILDVIAIRHNSSLSTVHRIINKHVSASNDTSMKRQ